MTFLNLLACKILKKSDLVLVITIVKLVTKFISSINKSIVGESIRSKIIQSNFIAALCDGSTDFAVNEKESIYVLFMDLDKFQPTL